MIAASARARLARVIREAAMQSRRAYLPELLSERPLPHLARHPGLVVADPTGGGAAQLSTAVPEWLVVVGPEGGLDPAEREELAAGARLAVGPHVLRAVTAPVAVAAALVGSRSGARPGTPNFPGDRA